jgi:hypothetical protein
MVLEKIPEKENTSTVYKSHQTCAYAVYILLVTRDTLALKEKLPELET